MFRFTNRSRNVDRADFCGILVLLLVALEKVALASGMERPTLPAGWSTGGRDPRLGAARGVVQHGARKG